MTLSTHARRWHDAYVRCEDARDTDAAARNMADAINAAFVAAARAIRAEGYGTNSDDHAETLIAAIAEFFFRSNPSFQAAIPAQDATP